MRDSKSANYFLSCADTARVLGCSIERARQLGHQHGLICGRGERGRLIFGADEVHRFAISRAGGAR